MLFRSFEEEVKSVMGMMPPGLVQYTPGVGVERVHTLHYDNQRVRPARSRPALLDGTTGAAQPDWYDKHKDDAFG